MKSRSLKSRVLAFLLVVCMVVGLTPVYAVSVETFNAGETKTVSIDPGETVAFQFTPSVTGSYTLYTSDDYGTYPVEFEIVGQSQDMWQQNGSRGMSGFDLQAGTTYTWKVWSDSGCVNVPLTLVKADAMTGLTLVQSAVTGFVGTVKTIEATITPNLGVDRMVIWTTSNPSIAFIEATSLTSCNVKLVGIGTTDVTASWMDDNGTTQTATCQVTAAIPDTIAVGDIKNINLALGESVTYALTAGANGGEYLFSIPSGQNFSFQFDGAYYEECEYYTDDECCHIFKMHPNETMYFTLGTHDTPLNTTLSVENAVLATDFSFPNGTTIELTEGEEIHVSADLVGGNYLMGFDCVSSDTDIVNTDSVRGNSFTLQGQKAGTVTITVQSGNITKTLDVTVKSYGAAINDKWVGNLTNHDLLKFTYTPTADGYYFIHHQNLGTRVIPELGTTEPVSDFDYNMNGYEGTVFELKAGETYHFMTEDPIIGNYAIYLSPIQLATSWSIPATLSGAVDEELQLNVTANGTMAPTYTTTNGDVVRVGGSNVDHASLFLIAAGTADIIVTDQFGNEQRCTVTVSGKLPTQTLEWRGDENKYWDEMGLAAGESVTYHYTPNESGLYWIYSELDYNLGINLTENGTPVAHEYAFNKADCKGKIYDLTANTTYELTFTSSVSMSTFVNAKKVEEAVTLHLDRNQREFAVGEDLHIDYLLEDRNGNAGVADITAQSSDTSVVSILSVDGEATYIQAMGAGVAEVYIVANGVTYGPVTVNVVTLGTPGGNTQPNNLIISSNNGTDFTLHFADGSADTFSGWLETYADPADGNTLSAQGVTGIDLDTSTRFVWWSVYEPIFDNDGNIVDWTPVLGANNEPLTLPNATDILTYPIGSGVKFVAEWDLGMGGNQGGPQNGHQVEIIATGVPFMHSVPDENGNIVSGEIGNAFGTTIASGTTLSDAGISVWQYAHNDPYFEGWTMSTWDTATDSWMSIKNPDGSSVILDTATMLSTPITEDVLFEASWLPVEVCFDGNGGTFDMTVQGSSWYKDAPKAAIGMPYHTSFEYCEITDIRNGSETFYGWDVYEEVEDPNNPGFTILIPVRGPMSTADVLSLPITYNVVFRANWTGNAPGGGSSSTPGTPAPHSAGLCISGNGGTFDIVRTNSQGKTEIWEDAEHTREDMYVSIGDTLADFGITDLTDIKFWDNERAFLGWQVYGVYTVTNQWGSYEEYGPLSDKIYTTKEILAYPAEKTFIDFVAVWAGDDADYFTDVTFDALGGTFLVTAFDYTEEVPVVLGTIPMDHLKVEDCMENGQSIKEQFDSSFYPISDPVRTGYTFEGWLAFYEDQYLHEMSDKLYTTEQVVNLPIPEENVQYLAKWKEISMDEYRFGDPYFPYDGTYVKHYTVANGGDLEISVNYSGGKDTYSMPFLSHQGQSSMSFLEHTKDISGLEFEFDLTDKTNFEGWTTYQAERLFIIHLLEGNKLNLPANNYTAFKIDTEEYEDENGDPINLEIYMVLKNAKIYSTTMTPKEVLQLKGDTFYATMAQWHEASATLANVKAATCAAEGYTGDKVCAKCGEVLVKGEAIAKLAHTPSANLVNVKSATHTEEGYTGDVVCADCGAVIETGKVIDKVKETVATPVVKEESKAAVDSQIQDVVAVISGEKTEETKIVLSEGTEKAIEEAVIKGDVVGADIVIEPISEENLSAEELASFKKEAAAIENTATAELGDTATVAEFIDISVIVKNRTTGEELGNITELAKPVTIEILVPAALQAENREYYIVHFHDGQATLIKGDYKDGVLTISADKFSTYALVYADVPETPDPIVPATGDQSHLVFFTTMLLLSAAGIYLASRKLRRA